MTHSATLPQLLKTRPRDLGGFEVRRLLPSAERQSVGPFVFFDHMGPTRFPPGGGIDVRPHPHIGLATITYLFEGEIMHRDSLGFVQPIRPGDVNWMTAGRGIVHSERTSPGLRDAGSRSAWITALDCPTQTLMRKPSRRLSIIPRRHCRKCRWASPGCG